MSSQVYMSACLPAVRNFSILLKLILQPQSGPPEPHFFLFQIFKCICLLNWRIITLQYSDDFCHTSIWIGHMYTCVPSILIPPPSPPCSSRLSEHRPWVTWFIHQTLTGYLFYIWQCICFSAILSNHPTLSFSHWVQSLFFTFVSPFSQFVVQLLSQPWQGLCFHFSLNHIFLSFAYFAGIFQESPLNIFDQSPLFSFPVY